jgi:hypothetical protein
MRTDSFEKIRVHDAYAAEEALIRSDYEFHRFRNISTICTRQEISRSVAVTILNYVKYLLRGGSRNECCLTTKQSGF